MDRVEWDVEEEWFIFRLVTNDPRGFRSDQVGRISLILASDPVFEPIQFVLANMGEIIERALQMSVPMIKAAGVRPVSLFDAAEVPLSADGRGVAGFAQGLGQGTFLQGKAVVRPWTDNADLQTIAHRVTASHER